MNFVSVSVAVVEVSKFRECTKFRQIYIKKPNLVTGT